MAGGLGDRTIECVAKKTELGRAAEERRFRTRPNARGCWHDLEEAKGAYGRALFRGGERGELREDRIADDRARRLPQQDVARGCSLLQSGRDPTRGAEDQRFVRVPARRQHLSRVQSRTGRKLDAEDGLQLGAELDQPCAQLDGRQHRAQGVVLVRDRGPEDGNDPIADGIVYRPSVLLADGLHRVAAADEQGSEDLGVEPFAQFGRAGEVRDETGDPPPERPHRGLRLRRWGRGPRPRFLPEDRLLELPQVRRRLDPELVYEQAPSLTVGREGLRLAAGAVEREHELAAEALAERVVGDERLEVTDDVRMAAQRELGLDP